VPTLVKDPNGREKCESCQLCEFVCPPKAIRITPGEIPEEERNRACREGPEGVRDQHAALHLLRLCQEVCPEEAIWLQDIFSLSGYSREEMVFNNKAKLYELGGTLPDKHYKWDKKKAAEKAGNPHH
jgi:NADH-quinone oxidoreductase subunit I